MCLAYNFKVDDPSSRKGPPVGKSLELNLNEVSVSLLSHAKLCVEPGSLSLALPNYLQEGEVVRSEQAFTCGAGPCRPRFYSGRLSGG